MRHVRLYGGAFVCAIVFYLLQQALRASYYGHLTPPMSGAVVDGMFAVVYGLCIFVMIGATTDLLWRHYARRQAMKRRLAFKALSTSRPARETTPARKSKVFY